MRISWIELGTSLDGKTREHRCEIVWRCREKNKKLRDEQEDRCVEETGKRVKEEVDRSYLGRWARAYAVDEETVKEGWRHKKHKSSGPPLPFVWDKGECLDFFLATLVDYISRVFCGDKCGSR